MRAMLVLAFAVVFVFSAIAKETRQHRSGITTASDSVPAVTCDDFIRRLNGAESALGVPVPQPDHNYSDLSESVVGNLTTNVAYINRQLNDEDHIATLYCTKEGSKPFEQFQLNAASIYDNQLTNTRTVNLIAAALYAYTGWPRKVVFAARHKLIDDLLKKKRQSLIRGEGDSEAEQKLPQKGVARLSSDEDGVQFYITLDE